MSTKAVPLVRPMIAYSLLFVGSTQPQMSLPLPPSMSALGMRLRRLMPEQAKSPAMPPTQSSGPVLSPGGGGGGGGGGALVLLPPHAAVNSAITSSGQNVASDFILAVSLLDKLRLASPWRHVIELRDF